MTLQIDLSQSPYFDDFDANSNYYQVLYRPGVAVQTRELNAMQSILQDQISKFGRNLIKDGSVTEGCAFTFDNNYQFVKINDNYANGTAFTISNFVGNIIYNNNGLQASIVNAVQGFQSQDPYLNTLYVKYLNTAVYSNGSPQSTFNANDTLVIATTANVAIGNVTAATSANGVTGVGYAFTTTNGTIFKDGYFINVLPQTIVVDAFNNAPDNISVGFEAIENIITPEANSALYDNASSSPNYLAPGAHRLQLIPTLVTRQTNAISNTTSFFSLCDFVAGYPVSIKNNTQFASIEDEMARRTYETNGNFIVTPFVLSTKPRVETNTASNSTYSNTTYLSLVSSAGEGYVEGYNVDFLNNNITSLRKATDLAPSTGAVVTTNYGYYITVQEYVGDFQTNKLQQIQLHSVAKNAISSDSFLGVGYSATTQIGTAYIRGVEFNSGTAGTPAGQYIVYLFNVQMYPGWNFSSVKSIINYNSSNLNGVADIVLTYNATTNSYSAVVQQSNFNSMIFPFGQQALSANGFTNQQYVYRRANTSTFNTSGVMTVSLGTPKGSATEIFENEGTETGIATASFIIIPTTSGTTANKNGNVSVTASQSNVVANGSTAFLTDYSVGDFIDVNNQIRQITAITNNTLMTVSNTFNTTNTNSNHYKIFPAGVPLDFTKMVGANTRNIISTSGSATFNLGENLTGTMGANVYYDVLREATVPVQKILNPHVYVAINCASHPAGSTGPWSLGLPDVFSINAIYVNNGTFSNTVSNSLGSFAFDNGQRDNYYGLAQISAIGNSLNANSRILVDLNAFTYNQSQGVGFFNANSYPIDDVNTSNTYAIQTQLIPQYYSTSGIIYDLRDSIDFRPWANNTANASANSTNWTTVATVNPSAVLTYYIDPSYGSFVPTPDTNYQANIQSYYARTDIAAITTSGQFRVFEGKPSVNPIAPPEPNGVMTLGIVNVPPYPSLSTPEAKIAGRYDYAVTTTITQQKRYTMKDIGGIAKQINNLQYYTSLSLLEQSATNLLVRSGTTGQNRFQNGILVDSFSDHSIGNTLDPTYNIAIDSSVGNMRPAFAQMSRPIRYNANASSNTVKVGKYVMLNYTESPYLSQPYASKYRNAIEGNIYNWNGTITFNPSGATSPDLTTSPDVTTDLDLASNWVNIASAFGTSWSNWSVIQAPVGTVANTKMSTNPSSGNKSGTVTTTYSRTGTSYAANVSTTNYNLGTFVTDVSILPYMQPIITRLTATGLKPNTRVYGFVNNVDINSFLLPATAFYQVDNAHVGSALYQEFGQSVGPTDTVPAVTANIVFAPANTSVVYGSPLYSDSTGTARAYFSIPANTFTATTLNVSLVDVPNIITGANDITTQAIGTFYGTNISISKGSSILSAQQATFNISQVTQTQNVVTHTGGGGGGGTVTHPGNGAGGGGGGNNHIIDNTPSDDDSDTTPQDNNVSPNLSGFGGGSTTPGLNSVGTFNSLGISDSQYTSQTINSYQGYSDVPGLNIQDNSVDTSGATGDTTNDQNSDPGTDGSNDSKDSGDCHVPWALIAMADGSFKQIQYIKVGDLVLGYTGINTVTNVRTPNLDSRLVSFNNVDYFVSETHPLLTDMGWGAFNPELLRTQKPNEYDNVMMDNAGKELVTISEGSMIAYYDYNGKQTKFVPVENVKYETREDYIVYRLSVTGDKTYIAESYVAHNKE